MPVIDDFPPGRFCWVDLNAHDLEAATAWYGGLFGWTPAPQPSPPGAPPYTFFMKGDAVAAAGGQMSDEMKAAGVPPLWNSYVRVADCAATQAKAEELGATVVFPTFEIPGRGKLCYLQDPGGATFALWQSLSTEGPGVLVVEHGGLSWNELMTRDTARAREFYGALFGWTFQAEAVPGFDYTVLVSDGENAGGMMKMDGEQFEGVPEHWLVYFHVDDCDAVAKRAGDTGGTVCVPPTDIPVGRFAVLQDPQGGTFCLMQLNEGVC